MGYCYDMKMRLCCDLCGQAGGVRKHRCPHGYCPSPALCAACKKIVAADGRWKKAHITCKAGHDAMVARDRHQQELLDAGFFVRCSAMSADNGQVQVLFENKAGVVIGKYMDHATYDAIPLLQPVTPEDYAMYGAVSEAPGAFSYGQTTKQCSIEEVLA